MKARILLVLVILINITPIGILYVLKRKVPIEEAPVKAHIKITRKKTIAVCKTTNLLRLQYMITADETRSQQTGCHDTMSLYRKMQRMMPQIATVLAHLEKAYAKNKKYDDAIAAHKASQTLNPKTLLHSLGSSIIEGKQKTLIAL